MMINLINKKRKIMIVLRIHGCFISIVMLKFLDLLVLIILRGRMKISIIQFSLGLYFSFLNNLVRNSNRINNPLI